MKIFFNVYTVQVSYPGTFPLGEICEITRQINGVRNVSNTFREISSIATLHSLMVAHHTVYNAGLLTTGSSMPKDGQINPINVV
jgi:hypothetical protein